MYNGILPWESLGILIRRLPQLKRSQRVFTKVSPLSNSTRVDFNFQDGSALLTIWPLQNLAAETAAYLTTRHPDYAILAARIAISNLHKETKKSFSQVVDDLYKWGT
jgi:hypothetical protein